MKFLQRFGRSLMLPVAVLPLAAILSGLGYWIINATGNDANLAGVFLQTAGGALLDNLPLLFAIGVSKIGRASCRERVWVAVAVAAVHKELQVITETVDDHANRERRIQQRDRG